MSDTSSNLPSSMPASILFARLYSSLAHGLHKSAGLLPRGVKGRIFSFAHTVSDLPGRWFDGSGAARKAWRTRLPSEIAFWDQEMASRGAKWPDDFRRRITPNWPLQDFLIRLIPEDGGNREVHLLDVGAGPLTQLGTSWPGRIVHVTAVDPLAEAYDSLLKKHGLVPPVRTIPCEAERVLQRFGECSFDLVYARNSLDHSYDPLLAIRQAVAVVKPGCAVYLEHLQNEGTRERGHGLHKWNFRAVNGDFVVERIGRPVSVNVTRELAPLCDSSCRIRHGDLLIVTLRKKAA